MEETRAGMKIMEPKTRHDRRPCYTIDILRGRWTTYYSGLRSAWGGPRCVISCLFCQVAMPGARTISAGFGGRGQAPWSRQMLDSMASVILMPAPCLQQALTNSRYRGALVTLPRPSHLRYTGISSTTDAAAVKALDGIFSKVMRIGCQSVPIRGLCS